MTYVPLPSWKLSIAMFNDQRVAHLFKPAHRVVHMSPGLKLKIGRRVGIDIGICRTEDSTNSKTVPSPRTPKSSILNHPFWGY